MCNSKKTKKEICKQNKTPKIKNIKVEKDKFDKLLSAMKNGKNKDI